MKFGGDRLFYVNLVDEMSKCYYCSLWVMNYGAGAWSHGKSASIWWLCKSEWCLNAGLVGLFLW